MALDEAGNLDIETLLKPLDEGIEKITTEMEKARRLEVERAPARETSPPPAVPTTQAAPLNVELPKFNGNPTEWNEFEGLFRKAMETRASGYSETDRKHLLKNSLETAEACEAARRFAAGGRTLDEILKKLRHRFSSAQVVYPILVGQATKPDSYGANYKDCQCLYDDVVGGYYQLRNYDGDPLSTFLLA